MVNPGALQRGRSRQKRPSEPVKVSTQVRTPSGMVTRPAFFGTTRRQRRSGTTFAGCPPT